MKITARVGIHVAAMTVVCLTALAATPPFLDGIAPRMSSVLPRDSVAGTEGALSTITNPAALEARKEAEFIYLRALRGDYKKDDAFLLAWRGLGVGLEYLTADAPAGRVSVRTTTLSGGSNLGRGLYWGTRRTWFASDDIGYSDLATWDVGGLYRTRNISLAMVARNVDRREYRGVKLERSFDFGIALRPDTDRLRVSFDLSKPDDESFRTAWKKRRYFGSVHVEPIRGFRVAANAYGDGQYEARATISIDTAKLGFLQRFEDGDARAGVAMLTLQEGVSRSALRRPRFVLITTPEQWRGAYWRVRRDPRVVAVVLKFDGKKQSLAAWKEAQDQLLRLKEDGTEVVSYISRAGGGGYWLASIADAVLLDPIGEILLVGLHSSSQYYKGAMDALGIKGYFRRSGEYKGGPEPFTQTGPSRPVAENHAAVLDDLYDQIVGDIATRRGFSRDEALRVIDAGPYLGEEALEAGIADTMATPEEAETFLAERYPDASLISVADYIAYDHRPTEWAPARDKIAVVRIDGAMVDGDSMSVPIVGTRLSGAGTVNRAIQDAAADTNVKAIVLDIDSGGGLVSASESIWRTTQKARARKPIVARIGGIGASGAYYVAAGTDRIIASPASVTGSIGVYTGHVSLRDLYAKLGVSTHDAKRGENADFRSRNTNLTERQEEVLQRQSDTLYDLFLTRVSEGREMDRERVHELARGQVWTGRQAHERALVDQLGGMREAIDSAKDLAGIPRDRLARVELLPKPSLLRKLMDAGLGAAGRGLSGLLGRLPDTRHFAWEPMSIQD
ncbi:signal peptide peptidase SppA [Candidatus Poribacteria bacterium]|nr:signal peptide peptidase SppA [Candidatus Poribacteria bacterium]